RETVEQPDPDVVTNPDIRTRQLVGEVLGSSLEVLRAHGAVMAGRLAIAAVTSRVTLRTDRFCAGSQPAARNALSISAAVPRTSTLKGSPSTVPVRFSERG